MTRTRETRFGFRKFLRHLSGRLIADGNLGLQFVRQQVAGLAVDFSVLARHTDGKVIVKQTRIDGLQMLVCPADDVGREIYYLGRFEQHETSYLSQNTRETDICVDVGANVGYYTLLLARIAKRGIVHAFEPVPLNYHLLTTNVLINGLTNVIANTSAIGDSDENVDLFVAKDPAFSSLIDTGRKPILKKIQVQMQTLDRYCSQHNIDRIDLMKIDVEGAEEKVLSGAPQLLGDRNRRPRLVMLELYDPMLRRYGSAIEQVVCRMRAYGYRPFVWRNRTTIPFSREHYNKFYNVFFSSDHTQ